MNKIALVLLALLLTAFLSFAFSRLAMATIVFSDDFSIGNFAKWSETYVSLGSSQTVKNGMAYFIVPTPQAGTHTFSYVKTNGFVSTVNSTITATQNVYFTNVPNGCPQGNGAIFFLYICDSSDPSGNNGNFGVGIDGSGIWSLWIGGSLTYSHVFQTEGSTPVGDTWYHIVLTIDNSAGTVALAVNGALVISASQRQFTDKTHYISLMSGIGENWWSDGGQQEVAVINVTLEISDADSQLLPSPTSLPSYPLPTKTTTPDPPVTPTHTASPSPSPSATPDVPEFSMLIVILLLLLVGSVGVLKLIGRMRTG